MLLTSTAEGIFLKKGGHVLKVSESGVALVSDGSKVFSNEATYQEIEGILGVISLKVGKYLITINSAELFGRIFDHEVLKVANTSILPLNNYSNYDADEDVYLKLLRFQLDSSNLFFSHSYDLTNSVQRNFDTGSLKSNLQNVDLRFFWNEYLSQEIITVAASAGHKASAFESFVTPVVSGYAKILVEYVNGEQISLGLLTRRSKYRAGTRYFRRGIDSKGHVANYNETEQIVIYGNTICSYLQTRGSVPVYWAEINNLKYRPQLAISTASSIEPAKLHFDEQVEKYGENYLVNLVNQKGYELPVKNAYENVVKQLKNDKLKYIYFDFHHECRKMKWHRVYLLIDKLQELGLGKNDYFLGTIEKTNEITTIRKQKHIVRTNCMDCLDRTNVVQSTLGRFFLQNQLEQLNIVKEGQKWDSNIKLNFEFQNFWADNADAVSAVYSGTGALKTDFTRTGTRTRKGAFADFTNSVSRYIKNNYKDGSRQDSFDLILGEYIPGKQLGGLSPFADTRPYQLQYILRVFLFFLFLLVAVIFKALVYGLQTKQHILAVITVVGLFSSLIYMVRNGLQVVNWPRLKQVDFLKKVPVYENNKYVGNKFVRNPEY